MTMEAKRARKHLDMINKLKGREAYDGELLASSEPFPLSQ